METSAPALPSTTRWRFNGNTVDQQAKLIRRLADAPSHVIDVVKYEAS